MTFAAPSPSLSSNDKLTDEDKQLLVSGELVVKQKSEQQGSLKLIGGQSWQIVDVPVDIAWQAVADLSRYKRFIPLATESFVKHQAGNEADLAMRQQWGPIDVRYVFQTTLDPDGHSMVFRVDHSQAHDIRAGWGFIKVRPFKGNRSLVSFGALVDIGDGVFVSIIRPAVRKDLLRIPFYFKRHLEGDGRMLYIGGGP
ncbi:MAG: SRPBCC family protein [Deltaproteobacteria bacterium]|nr:SRPBCC family protein [Deltaproteobacteria bacterium]MBW2158831.1 SRPBCC family protein [Deltaproteobacteria bacterium]MBW2587227.1 SRPBCC family protein [Deltaproteobacteria bacterium]